MLTARSSIPLEFKEQNTLTKPLPELSSDSAFSYCILKFADSNTNGSSVLGHFGFMNAS